MAGSKTTRGNRGGGASKSEYQDRDKPTQIRYSNITAAKGRLKYIMNLSIIFYMYIITVNSSLIVIV